MIRIRALEAERTEQASEITALSMRVQDLTAREGASAREDQHLVREGRRVAAKQLLQIGEGGVALRQVVERSVAGVARVMMLAAPALAGSVVASERADRMREIGQQRLVLVRLGAVES